MGEIAYKGFNKDLKCLSFQYEIGKTYEMKEDEIEVCSSGFHFCKRLIDIMQYYDTKNGNRFCKVEVLGIEKTDDDKKFCTNKIKILEEIPIEEVLKEVNTGDYNTGNYNTGNYNTGNYNTGNCNTGNCNTGNYNTGYRNTGYRNTGYRNTGYRNTGYRNTGDCNTGNYNTGYRNTGNCNTGDCNTGNCNTGNYNTGDCNTGNYNTGNYNTGNCNTGNYNTGNCNTGNYNTGLFNTNEPTLRMFNKDTDLHRGDIDIYRVNEILSFIDKREIKLIWKYREDMTKEEVEKYPECETTGGVLMKVEVKVNLQEEWEKVSEEDKDFIKSLPNFDKDIFYECTGIKV